MDKKLNFAVPTPNQKKRKEWKDLDRKEKITGIVTLIVLFFIVVSVINAIAGGNKATNDVSNVVSDNNSSTLFVTTADKPKPKPTPPPKPKVYTGTGDEVVKIEKPNDGPVIVKFECPACSSNTVVTTNGYESLIVNTIGSFSGSHLIDINEGSTTSRITINAVGSWKLTVSSLAHAIQVNGKASGKGDAVLHLTDNTTQATINNTGEENFVVNVYPENGGSSDLAVNTIGSYKGTVLLEAPAYVQIESSGVWSLTAE